MVLLFYQLTAALLCVLPSFMALFFIVVLHFTVLIFVKEF